MRIAVKEYDIGCLPSPSVPAETLIQDGWCTYLLFFARTKTVGEDGYLKDLGVAVMECVDCASTRFGYPNDEGLPEHPYYAAGVGYSGAYEIVGSPWAKEVTTQQRKSAERIWSGRGYKLSDVGERPSRRHFILPLKEATFECVANDLVVVHYAKDFDEAFTWVRQKLSEH